MRIIHGRRSAGGSEVCIVTTGSYNDATEAGNAALIAAAVNALPALIARVRELERERDDAALAMRERCAQACEEIARSPAQIDDRTDYVADDCAAAVRALEP